MYSSVVIKLFGIRRHIGTGEAASPLRSAILFNGSRKNITMYNPWSRDEYIVEILDNICLRQLN